MVDITEVALGVADTGVEKVGDGGVDMGDRSPLGEAGGRETELVVGGGWNWSRDDET